MIKEIISIADYIIVTRHKVMDRGADTSELVKEMANPEVVDDVKAAVKRALELADKNDMVLVTGSLFTVAEARELWHKEVDFRWGRELNEG